MIHFEKVSFEQYYKDRTKVELYLTEEEVRSEYDAIKLPKRATTDSAGYDFFAPYTFDLIGTHSDKAEETKIHYELIPTGIRFITDNKEVFLACVPRSGLGFRNGFALANTIGVIDSSYFLSDNEGHIMAKVYAETDVSVEQGKAFMQGIIIPFIKTSDDDATGIRNGGFGSTDGKIEAVEIKEKENG